MVKRLAEDHTMARRLAEGIDKIDGWETQLERVRTNILFFDLVDKRLTSSQLLERAATKGVLSLYVGDRRFRMVTHYGLTIEDIDKAVKSLQEVMATA